MRSTATMCGKRENVEDDPRNISTIVELLNLAKNPMDSQMMAKRRITGLLLTSASKTRGQPQPGR